MIGEGLACQSGTGSHSFRLPRCLRPVAQPRGVWWLRSGGANRRAVSVGFLCETRPSDLKLCTSLWQRRRKRQMADFDYTSMSTFDRSVLTGMSRHCS
jgi:hypothetical protein